MITFYEKMSDLFAANVPFVAVTVVDTIGSVPNEAGSKMLVTMDGLLFGTVGGGKIENRAIQEAQKLLAQSDEEARQNATRTMYAQWALDRDIGMTCGGSVRMYFEAFNVKSWHITIFGAGHVANALINILVNLDCRITCVDPRVEWLDKLPESSKLKKVACDDMPKYGPQIPDGSYVLLITMGHGTDKPILLEILRHWKQRQFPYLGAIGSKAKAARLRNDVKEAGLRTELCDVFYCPIGIPVGSNHPQEIAISVAAQLLQVRDAVSAKSAEKESKKEGIV
ncbi:MAG TPA: xanthine dehydrogenase accessory protein XdhC [Candidatus Obscuribacterales bacterium]